MLRYFATSASTSILCLTNLSIVSAIAWNPSSRWWLLPIRLHVVIVYIAARMLHRCEWVVTGSTMVSLCLAVLFIVAFNMLWWSVSLSSCCLFSILFRYYGQRSITFVVPVVDLLFLSCHEVFLLSFVCIHVSIVILILLLPHLVVWINIIVDLRFDLLMNHSTRVLIVTSSWSNFLVLMSKAISFVVLDLDGADVSSFILLCTMFVSAKVSFAGVFNSSCTLMWHLSASIILLMEETRWREQMTLCRSFVSTQVFEWWNVAVVLESSHWSFVVVWDARVSSVFQGCNRY